MVAAQSPDSTAWLTEMDTTTKTVTGYEFAPGSCATYVHSNRRATDHISS